MPHERVAEHLNRTLHALFAADGDLFLLGEDIADPYGGAFRVTKGLSTAYADRVLTTPLSENGFLGVASGLALAGNRVIAEVMFGDFIGLAFDQIVNFAAPSVTMYGRTLPMCLLVRCPVGGHRGYGPTHSQSPQKHLIGVANLAVYEMSALHDAGELYAAAFARRAPGIMVEHKVVYAHRMYRDGIVDDTYRFEPVAGPGHWVRIRPAGRGPARVVLITTGGMLGHALQSAHELCERDGLDIEILVTAQLYPLAVEPVLEILAAAGAVAVAEESTAGGTWGAEVAAALHGPLWSDLRAPVALVSSRPSIIPTAPHLEREVLVQPATITAAVRRLVDAPTPHRAAAAAAPPPVPVGAASHPILVPTLNANDTTCTLVEWLGEDGQLLAAGDPVAVLETAKAASDLEVDRAGRLRRLRRAGEECAFGDILGYLDDVERDAGGAVSGGAGGAVGGGAVGGGADEGTDGTAAAARSRVQAAVAATVALSHRTIPAAFCTARVRVDAALEVLDAISERTGAVVDLAALIVKAVAELSPGFPDFFGTVSADGELRRAVHADVGVTVDADNGLFVPVIRDVAHRALDEVADELVLFRLAALEGRFDESVLAGGGITVSLNLVDGVDVVQPLIVPPQVAIVSVGGIGREPRLDPAGGVDDARVAAFGLGYDHRVVNGRAAAGFLARLKALIERPEWTDPAG